MKIAVLGAGTMGQGIVEMLLPLGFEVVWYTRQLSDEKSKKLNLHLNKGVRRAVRAGHIDSAHKHRVNLSSKIQDVAAVDFIIEAVTEDLVIKQKLISELNNVVVPKTIFASNTSSLLIKDLSKIYRHPQSFLGLHFFNPAPMMKLVEFIATSETSETAKSIAETLLAELGKTVVKVEDSPGFIVNRLLMLMINEAVGALDDGIATAESIDQAMVAGANHPVGPLKLADMIGLDIVVNILNSMQEQFDNGKFAPHSLMLSLVSEGKLGRKSKSGFYQY